MKIEADWLGPVRPLMDAFENAGFSIYFVGGCVRNALLNEGTTDIDLSTNARPSDTIEIAKRSGLKSIPTGIDHGTITILLEDQAYEVTSFRKDVATDGRRAVVAFSDDICDDARRRDFTMNAIYADKNGTVVDPLNGLDDLIARRLQFIEDADQRIKEDYLRILRYFRFFAFYAKSEDGLDGDILSACAENLDGLDTLSKERIGSEMKKILSAPNPSMVLSSMEKIGVLHRLLPGASSLLLAQLVDQEVERSWVTRLVMVGGEDPVENLRLSKKEANLLRDIKRVIENLWGPAEAAYRVGTCAAISALQILSISSGSGIPTDLLSEIDRGSSLVFPIKSSDLTDDLQGKELGDKLRDLEDKWIDSNFQLSARELLTK